MITLLQLPAVREVNLTGTGGTGKTRLALEVAARLVTQFENGAFFVSLAPLTDAALAPSAIAEAVGVHEREGVSFVDALKLYFVSKHVLVVLDNVEHVLDAASAVGELLSACRDLHVLATSRIPLQLSGEHEYDAQTGGEKISTTHHLAGDTAPGSELAHPVGTTDPLLADLVARTTAARTGGTSGACGALATP